jgi:hypothetical protein
MRNRVRVDDEITILKSGGGAIEDVCVAGIAYEKAVKQGFGKTFGYVTCARSELVDGRLDKGGKLEGAWQS